ncbi:zinc finger protein AZF1-like [Punica granatum]|uniref:C2H2-type domain-containing protein n=2 Tax=Punica granatum TaxID=22663 RepID=A0A218XBP0_PUNGR|nr:zinc finger protein AZF1-like [Punica granatum]OWM82109.1 hypothetical protein CDL15_Pgr001683 [Punica granatum]PKI44904.1 hypothetical protein CRG98_034852 [Punica granatum]
MALEALNSPSSAGPLLHHEDMVDHQTWTKRKRTKRSHLDTDMPPSEEEYLALCLLMLAQGGGRGRPVTTHRPSLSPPPPSATNNGYKCSVCHREFHSYQALGGHKSSHKNKAVMEDHQSPGTTAPGPATSSHNNSATKKLGSMNSMSNSTRTHQCSVCLKTFASGQALGGHKRRHFEGGSAGGGTGSSLMPLTEDVDSGHSHHHGFDLNLPASSEHSQEANDVDFVRKSQLSGDEDVVESDCR